MAKVGVALIGAVVMAGVSLAVYFALLFHDIPDTDPSYRPDTATRVFAWDGTLIGEYSNERRVYVPYDQMPPQLVNAFLAAEDRNFFKHGAVDFQGLSRALIKDVYNIAMGRRLEGGSTSWSVGAYNPEAGMIVKYESEYEAVQRAKKSGYSARF